MLRIVLLVIGGVGCSGGPPSEPAPDPDYGDERVGTTPDFFGRVPSNLLMISIDTFRRDHFDRYGDKGLTPFMATLAEQGVVLDDHTQCSNWTYASTSCTLAGRYNIEAGFTPKLASNERTPWATGTPFLAGYLEQVGFDTRLLVSSNAWLSDEYKNTQGYTQALLPGFGGAMQLYAEGLHHLQGAMTAGDADRWFLHLHLTEPHAPYAPPEAYLDGLDALNPVPWNLAVKDEHYDIARGPNYAALSEAEANLLEAHLRTRYEGEIGWTDHQVRQIWTNLEQLGLLDDTLVVVWNDHGEQFWEHGYQTHAYTMGPEETEGILFFWAKNIVPQAIVEPTTSIDLTPTLLEIYGAEPAPTVTGLPLSQRRADRSRFALAVARLGVVQAVWREGMKLSYSWFGQVRVYDTEADPEELVDLYDPLDPSPEAQALWDELEPMIEAAQPLIPEYNPAWPGPLRD